MNARLEKHLAAPARAEDLPKDVGIRATAVGEETIRSFLASTTAMPDESLIGWLARVGAMNAHRSMSKSLRKVGVSTPRPASVMRSRADDAERVALLLKADPGEVIARTHPCVELPSAAPMVDFFGTPVRANYVYSDRRRVSPRALRISGHHRAVWMLLPLSFDPGTMETLIESCPVCGGPLGWQRTADVCFCDRCIDRDRRPMVDLRDFPQSVVDVEDMDALRFVASLVDPLASAPAFGLPETLDGLSRGDVFDLAVVLAGVLENDATGQGYARRFARKDDVAGLSPDCLAAAGRAVLDWPEGYFRIADRMRGKASERPKAYGLQKELGPLYSAIQDLDGVGPLGPVVRAAVEADLERKDEGAPLLRWGGTRAGGRITATEAARLAKVDRPIMSSLARTGLVKAAVETGIVVFDREEIERIVAERNAMVDVSELTACLGVPRGALPDLVAGGLIERVADGPALHLVEGREHYRRPGLDALLSELKNAVRGERKKGDLRLVLAASKSFVGHKPWRAIIEAVRSGGLEVRCDVNRKAGILNAMAVDPDELAAIISRAAPPVAADPEGATNYVEASAYFGVSAPAFTELTAIGLLPAYDRVNLRLRRGDLDVFAERYFFTEEVARRLGTTATEAKKALANAGVRPAATLVRGKVQVWESEAAEVCLALIGYASGAVSGSSGAASGSASPVASSTSGFL